MYALKVRDLLSERYSAHFLDLVHKLSRPVFGTQCCYSNTVMKLPLREKIQNAINRAVNNYSDFNNNKGEGPLIVGGRRRNRKKKNKKNGQKRKKNPNVDIKARLSPSGCRKGKDQDNLPLIVTGEQTGEEKEGRKQNDSRKKEESLEEAKTEPEAESVADNTNDITPDDGASKGDVSTTEDSEATQQGHDGEQQDAQDDEQTSISTADIITKEEAGQVSLEVELAQANGKPGVSFANDVQEGENISPGDTQNSSQDGGVITRKSEKSPLIGKAESQLFKDGPASNVRDSQPGCLCCAIL